MTDLAMNNGYRLESMQSSGMEQLGLVLSYNSRYTDNVIDNNNGGNANQQISGGTTAGVNTCGSGACP